MAMPSYDYLNALERMDDVYRKAEAKSGGSTPPDGKYQVRVERVEIKTSKRGNVYLNWELTILGPHEKGRKLFRKNMLQSEENLGYLKGDLAICGVEAPEHLRDLPSIFERLLDVELTVVKQTRKDDPENYNVYFNEKLKLRGGEAEPGLDDFPDNTKSDDNIPF